MPLTGYYVSDPDVVFEPMTDHLAEYSWGLAQYLGAGVAACYRGHRVFDSPATRCKSDCSFKFECFFSQGGGQNLGELLQETPRGAWS